MITSIFRLLICLNLADLGFLVLSHKFAEGLLVKLGIAAELENGRQFLERVRIAVFECIAFKK